MVILLLREFEDFTRNVDLWVGEYDLVYKVNNKIE